MAYFGKGKHTFKSLIDNADNEIIKAFLLYKKSCYYEGFSNDRCYIEQMLYNESAYKIKNQLNGFVAGFLHNKNKYIDFDQVMAQRDLMPVLAKIYKKMCDKNDWGSEMMEEWNDFLE